jgi:predicted enzyme related to lactoylglutathione lyase
MSNGKPPHGTFIWNELVTRDIPGAEKFYTELLGWKAANSDMPGMKYTVFKAGDRESGGLMEMPSDVPKEVSAHWMAYITVDDVDSAAEKTKQLGGQVLHGPQDVPNVGRFCIIQDPTGAVVSLMTMAG